MNNKQKKIKLSTRSVFLYMWILYKHNWEEISEKLEFHRNSFSFRNLSYSLLYMLLLQQALVKVSFD